jgi:hypothetical protein
MKEWNAGRAERQKAADEARRSANEAAARAS